MGRLLSIATSTLLSGGLLGSGTIGGYIGDSARRALGLGLSEISDEMILGQEWVNLQIKVLHKSYDINDHKTPASIPMQWIYGPLSVDFRL